jgi:hypothetical protein
LKKILADPMPRPQVMLSWLDILTFSSAEETDLNITCFNFFMGSAPIARPGSGQGPDRSRFAQARKITRACLIVGWSSTGPAGSNLAALEEFTEASQAMTVLQGDRRQAGDTSYSAMVSAVRPTVDSKE